MNTKLKIIIFAPFIFITLLAVGAGLIPFGRGESDMERKIGAFIPSNLEVTEKTITQITKVLKDPFDFTYADIRKKPVPSDSKPDNEYNDTALSLVVMSGANRIAVVNGTVVKEGDRINGVRIVKIEKDRVLLGKKNLRWVELETIR